MGSYLSSPKVDKESYDGGDLSVDPSRYGLSCMQGWRKNMEDSHICYSNLKIQEIGESISIYGVFDGHGGPNVSRWISYHFLPIFLKCLNIANEHLEKLKIDKNGEYYKLQLIKLSLEETFLKLDEEMRLRENQEKLKKYSVPQQKGDDELENRDNYIYSILNDIVSKNISIKAIEKDGKRCLQVVYNKDENALDDDVEGTGNDQEQSNATAIGKELSNEGESNTLSNNLPKEGEEEKESNNKEGKYISETKDKEETEIKGDDILKVTKESTTTSVSENDRESVKIEVIENNKITEEPKIEIEQKGAIFEMILEKAVDSGTEKKEANKENVETGNDKGKEENKSVIVKRLKKDEDAEEELKKKEESSFLGDHENKEKNPVCKKEETEKDIEVQKNEEEKVTTPNDKPEHTKSDLTFENLKHKEQEKKKSELTVLNEANEDDVNSTNPNGSLLFNSVETGYYEEPNDKQISIDEVLDSGDFRPFLEEFEDTDEDVEHVDDQDSGENIAYSCGSTAIVAVILKGYLLVANAGDSRAIVCFNGNSLGMSTDHKPHLEEEEMRIKRAGGYITNGRVDGNLNLTRAIGDLHYKSDPFLPQKDQKISAFPDIKCVTLTPEDEFLFLACDGIWDCKEGQEIVSFVKTRLNKFVEKKDDKVSDSKEQLDVDKEKNDSKDPEEPEKESHVDSNVQEKENKEEEESKNEDEEKQNESNVIDLEQKKSNEKSSPVTVTHKYETFDKLSQICEELCDDCLSSNCRDNDGIGCDNMTCLIVQYNPIYKSQTEKKFLDLDEMLTAEKFNSN